MKKRVKVIGLTMILCVIFGMTAFAGYTATAGWNWVNGYCYYYTDVEHLNKLTSCTTPDGYQVDAEGRWTENGAAVHNGYGSYVVGTDELYRGLDGQALIDVMYGKLKEFNSAYGNPDPTFGVFNTYSCCMSGSSDMFFTYMEFENFWNDSPECYVSNRSEFVERAIKTLVGDHVGQELFDQIRAAAEPAIPGGTTIAKDANGNAITYYDEFGFFKARTVPTASTGDGVNFNLFNWQAWNGRQTDYGKTIEIQPVGSWGNETGTPASWRLIIH